MNKKQIFTPGPTEVPFQTLLEGARPIVHHRKQEFKGIFEEAVALLKKVFVSNSEVFIFASSGTGAMESAVQNFTSEGDSALVIESGKFGQRWKELCETFGVTAKVIECEWGEAVDPAKVKEMLSENKDIKAVFATLVETSTGVLHPIKEIAQAVSKTDAVLIVDAVSGLGCDEIRADEWGVDVVVSGSQKALMTPPGLGFMCVGDKGKKIYESNARKTYYWNLKKASKSLGKLQTPYTPAVNLIRSLVESLKTICAQDMEKVWERHSLLARAARDGVTALGLEIFAKSPANGLTAVKIPSPDKIGNVFVKHIEEKHGIVFAGGQDHLKGKIFRIAHMGYYDSYDVIKAIAAVEWALKELGVRAEVSGEGVGAALKVFSSGN